MAPPPQPTATISLVPQNITDLSKIPGDTITFNITLSNSPSITLFGVWLQYNTSMLSPENPASNTIDSTGNILGSSAQIQAECVGAGQPIVSGGGSLPCGIVPSPDVLGMVLYTLGSSSTTVSGGLLYRVTFIVIGTGFARLHIAQYVLTNGVTAQSYTANTVDGFFTNKDCGSNFCKPLHVAFTYLPSLPSTGTTVQFNATSSSDPNTGGTIVSYTWSWGELTPCLGVQSTQVTTNPLLTHVFCTPQNYDVSLLVSDSYGVTWSVTQTVPIQFVFVDITHGGQIVASPQFNVLAGTPIKITADIINNSTQPVPANVTLTVEETRPLVTWTRSFNLTSRGSAGGSTQEFTGIWNTTKDLPIQVYRIDLVITTSVPQNVTNDKSQSTFVQFIIPQSNGQFSLSLLQSSGVGILVIVALGAGFSKFRKKPSWQNEPLTQE
jgi:PKD domain-containing protein